MKERERRKERWLERERWTGLCKRKEGGKGSGKGRDKREGRRGKGKAERTRKGSDARRYKMKTK